MDPTTLGILLGLVGIAITVALGLPPLLRRRSVTHWTPPTWNRGTEKIGTTRIPVVTVRWAVRGSNASIQGVECSVRGPSGKWRQLAAPKGKLDLPKENLYTYINLVDELPFNSVVASPVNIGKPVSDAVALAKKGRYQLRIRWYEDDKPRRREKVFSYVVR
ncbi:hypothetical protein NFC73_08960 [Pseudarthrobacter sp. RMG13]|uniref:Secreted protein n=1 Tax=Pseudarthrobacter humi TaxID=2952523 RepID=A0ABT1LN37_9MICC|nr:hypothetical protein [Pseudarthrobacter humi]MCP8999859.1 hypothetical protein [Pseudarthrobacter humi]